MDGQPYSEEVAHILATGEALAGPDEQYDVPYANLWSTGPGRAMPLHMDWQPTLLPPSVWSDPAVRVPMFWVQVIYVLSDLHLHNGPTALAPGSHKSGRPPVDETSRNGREAVAACLPAGSAVIFRTELWHGGLAHTADERRHIMLMGYGNHMINTTLPRWSDEAAWHPAVRERASESQARLLGRKAKQSADY